jgi:hypothetical protein
MLDVGRMAPKMPRTSAWSLEDSCFYVAVCLDGTNGWRRCRIVSELPSVEVGWNWNLDVLTVIRGAACSWRMNAVKD